MEAAPDHVEDDGSVDFSGREVCASLEVMPGIQVLEAMWRDLERRAEVSFFLSWDWIRTWLVEVALVESERAGSGAQPLLIVARRGSDVVGLGILHRKTVQVGPIRFEKLYLHQTGDDQVDCIAVEFNDFLLDSSCRDEARSACLNELLRVRSAGALRWRELHWAGAPCDLAQVLNAIDVGVHMYRTAPSPWVDVGTLRSEGRGYLEVLSRNTRYSIRRSMRLYEDEWGPLSISSAGSVDEALLWLEELRQLHQAHWEMKSKLGAFGRPFFSQFLRSLVSGASQHVHLLRIRSGDQALGYLCNFVHGGVVMNYQSGFQYSSDKRCKPGLISHALAIGYYIEERPDVKEYSFLAGDAQYKRSLSTAAEQLNWYIVKPRRLWSPRSHLQRHH